MVSAALLRANWNGETGRQGHTMTPGHSCAQRRLKHMTISHTDTHFKIQEDKSVYAAEKGKAQRNEFLHRGLWKEAMDVTDGYRLNSVPSGCVTGLPNNRMSSALHKNFQAVSSCHNLILAKKLIFTSRKVLQPPPPFADSFSLEIFYDIPKVNLITYLYD